VALGLDKAENSCMSAAYKLKYVDLNKSASLIPSKPKASEFEDETHSNILLKSLSSSDMNQTRYSFNFINELVLHATNLTFFYCCMRIGYKSI
jgi:hypothetical protein